MKKAWRYGTLCGLLYLLALLATAPARLVLSLLPEPASVTDVTGTLWSGHLLDLRWKNINAGSVRWRWGWYNGLPGLHIDARGGVVQGEARIGWLGSWRVFDTRAQADAAQIVAIAGARLPIDAQGSLHLSLKTLRLTSTACLTLEARLDWRHAQVSALGQPLALGEPRLDVRCEGALLKGVLRQPRLPLPFNAEGQLSWGGDYRVTGQTGSTDALPAAWAQMINSLTRPAPDGQRIMEVTGKWTLHRL